MGVMSLSLFMTAVVYLPLGVSQWSAVTPSTNAIVSVVILGIVCTALAFLLFADLIAEIGPVRATVITYINPAVAAVLGVMVRMEPATPGMAVGFVLVILGSALATRSRRAQTPAQSPAPIVSVHPTEPVAEAS